MNDLLKTLLGRLEGSSGGTKLVAALVGVAMLVAIGVTAVVTNEPHYEMAFSGLDDHEAAKVSKALADAGIGFRTSQPPGPYVVFVDEDDRSRAYTAAYSDGALDKPLKGIMTENGLSSVFLGNKERLQMVQKRAWEEIERMLETFDFVVEARVLAAPERTSALGRGAPPPTASVTITTARNAPLTREQAEALARVVSGSLGVAPEHLTIADQTGARPYDPTEDDADRVVADALEHQEQFDRRQETRANEVLGLILGPNKARVVVTSDWDFSQSTTVEELASSKNGILVSETRMTSESPVFGGGGGSGAGGPAGAGGTVGVSANTGDAFGTDTAGVPREESPTAMLAKTSEDSKKYEPTTTTRQTVQSLPMLKRLSIALFLDESIDAADVPALEATIKSALGFKEARDVFSSTQTAFHVPGTDEPVVDAPAAGTETPEDAPAEPNPLLETLLRRGVEVVTALVFIVLLLRSLKTSRKTVEAQRSAEAAAARAAVGAEELDPEFLARARLQELLESDPDRVGEILSAWAKGETAGAGT